jgi:hypothetical protein
MSIMSINVYRSLLSKMQSRYDAETTSYPQGRVHA